MTQQEQFEADYLTAFPGMGPFLLKFDDGDYVCRDIRDAHAVWLQQAKRHEVELRTKRDLISAQCVAYLYEGEYGPRISFYGNDASPGEVEYRLGIINPPPSMTLPEGAAELRAKASAAGAVPTTPGRICPEYIRDAARFHRLANPNPSHVTAEHIATLNDAANYIEFLEAQLHSPPAQAVSVPFDIEEYLSAYEWRAEDGGLSELTARDRQLLQDFANGLPLYTALPAQAVSVPEGWKLVPIKATPEMMEAGRDDALDQQCFEGFAMLDAKGVYDAMLAAAPEPPKP